MFARFLCRFTSRNNSSTQWYVLPSVAYRFCLLVDLISKLNHQAKCLVKQLVMVPPPNPPLHYMNLPNLSNRQEYGIRQNLKSLGKQAHIIVPGVDIPMQVDQPTLTPQQIKSMSGGVSGGVKPATGQALGYANDIPIPPTSKIGEAVVRAALQMRGIPYSWGGGGAGGPSKGIEQGANTVGFDCSGLTQYVFAKYGVTIPRVSYDQFRAGTPVPVKAMRPGDLVFFHPGANGPGHVGIFIGNNKFIQAPQTGEVVKISDLGARSDLVGVRRFG